MPILLCVRKNVKVLIFCKGNYRVNGINETINMEK